VVLDGPAELEDELWSEEVECRGLFTVVQQKVGLVEVSDLRRKERPRRHVGVEPATDNSISWIY